MKYFGVGGTSETGLTAVFLVGGACTHALLSVPRGFRPPPESIYSPVDAPPPGPSPPGLV